MPVQGYLIFWLQKQKRQTSFSCLLSLPRYYTDRKQGQTNYKKSTKPHQPNFIVAWGIVWCVAFYNQIKLISFAATRALLFTILKG